MQTPQPDNSEPDNDTDTSSPDRDSRSPRARLEAAEKQLRLARDGLDDLDINKHSRQRIAREIGEAIEATAMGNGLLNTHTDDTDAEEVDA
jgi:hypothetical protein